MSRTSTVGALKVNVVSGSSVVHIGDGRKLLPHSQALAAERVGAGVAEDDELARHLVSFRAIPQPAADMQVRMCARHDEPNIRVGRLRILGVGTASVLQIGSTGHVEAEARVTWLGAE